MILFYCNKQMPLTDSFPDINHLFCAGFKKKHTIFIMFKSINTGI